MRKIIVVALVILLTLVLAGCNMQVIDTVYHYDVALVELPDGHTVSGSVEMWRDYPDSDMVQVTIDGSTYFTHGSRVCLIDKKEGADHE